jgi:hypothetical protein
VPLPSRNLRRANRKRPTRLHTVGRRLTLCGTGCGLGMNASRGRAGVPLHLRARSRRATAKPYRFALPLSFAQAERRAGSIAQRQRIVWPRGADDTNIRLISTAGVPKTQPYRLHHTTCNIEHATRAAAVAALRSAVPLRSAAAHRNAVWAAALT